MTTKIPMYHYQKPFSKAICLTVLVTAISSCAHASRTRPVSQDLLSSEEQNSHVSSLATTFVVPGDDSDSDTGDVDIIDTSTSLAPGDPNAMDIEEKNPQ